MKEDILRAYNKVSKDYGYNSNSLHKLGLNSRKIETLASKQILETLGLNDYEVIYTSGNAESFSMLANNIKENIFTDNKDMIDICEKLRIPILTKEENIGKNTFISSEKLSLSNQKINHINLNLNKEYSDLNKYDFITIEDDLPFFGVLIKKKNIELKNLIHGGKSTTNYRSGTSATPLIVSFAKLVKLKYKK